jgi:outer membrane immunogenic protein
MRRIRFVASLVGIAWSVAASQVTAADLTYKAPPLVPSWTGFYVGLDFGYGWKDPTVTPTGIDRVSQLVLAGTTGFPGAQPLGAVSFENKGIFGGVEAGYNWQLGRSWLVGIEADFNASSIRGQGASSSLVTTDPVRGGPGSQQLAASQNVQWFGTVRPRAGWLATDNLLLYGTGGFAYGRVDDAVNYGFSGPTLVGVFSPGGPGFQCPINFGPCIGGTSSRIATGWTAGGGTEYRVPGTNASIKAEYLYVNLGHGDTITGVSPVIPAGAASASSMAFAFSQTDFHTVKLGLNWHF